MVRVGLIVNPVAGLGGPLAFKGSDDPALVEEARRRGAAPVAPRRALEALRELAAGGEALELLTVAGPMGEDEARDAGLVPAAVEEAAEPTTAADTRRGAAALAERGVGLLLFAGGDGTAVDVLAAVDGRVPVLGIPAGVKMHSAVFAVNPRSAGRLALDVVRGRAREVAEAEVLDVDEDALRAGIVSPRLHGYLQVPSAPALVQSAKARSAAGDRAAHAAIAAHLVEHELDGLVFVGPGTTTRAVLEALGLEKTVLGVDVLRDRRLVAADADERTLLALLDAEPARVLVTPIGGQGFVFGRGNQQLSARVLARIGREGIVVCATDAKLAALGGRPLLVDTGDESVDEMLAGYVRIVTGYREEAIYRIARGGEHR